MSLPLEGVRIVAVEQYGAGPFGTQHLADLGAEVIKIENPADNGDVGRSVGPYFFEPGDSHFYQSFNRNKKSVTIDLKSSEGQAEGYQRRDCMLPFVGLWPRGSAQGLAGLRLPHASRSRLPVVNRRAGRATRTVWPLDHRHDDRHHGCDGATCGARVSACDR